MANDQRSPRSPSYDADPRLPQGFMVIGLLLLVLAAGIVLIVHGLG